MSDSFLFYKSFEDIISQIPDAETQFKFYKAIVSFGLNGTDTEFAYPLNLAFTQMKASISSAQVKHEKRVAAGRKGGQKSRGGGAPRGNSNAKTTSKQQATTSKQQANVNVNDNELLTLTVNNYASNVDLPIASTLPHIALKGNPKGKPYTLDGCEGVFQDYETEDGNIEVVKIE